MQVKYLNNNIFRLSFIGSIKIINARDFNLYDSFIMRPTTPKAFAKSIYIISTNLLLFNSLYHNFKHFVNCNSVDFPLIKPY